MGETKVANRCNFTIKVTGPAEDLKHFNSVFRSSVEEIREGVSGGMKHIRPNDGRWGHFEEGDVEDLYLHPEGGRNTGDGEAGDRADTDEALLELPGSSEMSGHCKWTPPTGWLEQASHLMPSLRFSCRSTIEGEVYEEWVAEGGKARRVELDVFDGFSGAWVPCEPEVEEDE
jgi:hypothetical protein